MSPEYTDILDQAAKVKGTCSLSVTGAGLITLIVGGETIYFEQLDPMEADDAEWLEAASSTGRVLVISGDNLVITETRVDIETAAWLGTLVIGYLPVRS